MTAPVRPGQVAAVLADLAPSGTAADGNGARADRSVDPGDTARLPLSALELFDPGGTPGRRPIEAPAAMVELASRARVRAEETAVRVGWLWVTGTPEGKPVHFPLVSAPVAVGPIGLTLAGDVELTDLVGDPAVRDDLEGRFQFGGGALHIADSDTAGPVLLSRLTQLAAWSTAAAAAAGFPDLSLGAEPTADDPGVRVVAQLYGYLTEPPRQSATIASTLRDWSTVDLADTALARIYGLVDDDPGDVDPYGVESSIVLNAAQRAAVAAARTEPIVVVSGPPGTGKSQTLAAIAFDAIERGRSVLIGAPSEAAVAAIVGRLTELPGPDPIVFGNAVRHELAAGPLGQSGGARASAQEVRAATARHRAATLDYRRRADAVRELLAAERAATRSDPTTDLLARRAAPRWFGAGTAALAEADRLVARAGAVGGLFRRSRQARRVAAVRDHAGATTDDLDALAELLRSAHAADTAATLAAAGGLDLDATWPALAAAEEARRVAHSAWLNAIAHADERVDRDARGTMAAVAAALRAGRAARRKMLATIDGRELTQALPLWVGTLRDIDDLLPRSPGMFDLVIIDEGSQVDQVLAAPALCRGRATVVAGDPKQLRFVSFLADQRIDDALRAHGISDPLTAARLDVRRLSAFDLAAGAAPVRFLDEHFRSLPHLVAFSARRFYDGRLAIATRHPANDDRDCISVRFVDGTRDADGVNRAELDEVLALVRARADDGTGRSVGVVSPFRAHVDALEARVLSELEPATIDGLDLRLGTVHGFQGCECDVLIVSLALDPASAPAARAFAADENLFNVMITRARQELIVVTSLARDTPGLIGEYLRHADAPPTAPTPVAPPDPLAGAVVADLRRSGIPLTTGYPAGHHTLDVVVGSGDHATGVLFGVHPGGLDAHIDRRLELARAGWRLRDVYASRWADRAEQLAVELALEAGPRGAP